MITEERLKAMGWQKGDFYPAGSSKEYGYEYFYKKGSKRIRVNEKNGEILSYDGNPTSLIETEEDLLKYETR